MLIIALCSNLFAVITIVVINVHLQIVSNYTSIGTSQLSLIYSTAIRIGLLTLGSGNAGARRTAEG